MKMADVSERQVLMVSGAYPPDICGVGDYTARLMGEAPANWEVFVERDWSWRALPGIVQRLLDRKPAGLIIQYPTQGYGWSLIPHVLALIGWMTQRYRTIFMLHEFSSLSKKARGALAVFSRFSAHIIFTTEVERDRARAFPLFSRRVPTSVIGILSNIPWVSDFRDFDQRGISLAYFGHIRPNKGLEDFLDVVAEVRKLEPDLTIAVVGEIPAGYETFGEMVAERCRAIGIALILGLNDDEVAERLADTKILYLPFKDGVSARRGSVLAGLGNGAIVATRVGAATPKTLRPAIVTCTGGMEDVGILRGALSMSSDQAAALQREGVAYIAMALPRDWAHVASLYQDIVGRALR